MLQGSKSSYSISGFESAINSVINFIFYYRLVFVMIALVILCFSSVSVWHSSPTGEKFKSISIVFGLGSIAIGIFYSILNYENNHIKYKNDNKNRRYTLSFNSVSEWHKPTMVENLKTTKQMFDIHKHLIDENKGREFFDLLETDENARSALVCILNYFECISYGIKADLLDNSYMRDSLGGVARFYKNYYGFYINYRRSVHNSPDMWINFTEMVQERDRIK